MVKQCNSTVLSTSKPAFNGLPPEIRYEILKNLLHVGDIVLQFEIEPMSRRLPYCHDFENCVEETLSRYYQEETTLLGFHELSPAILAVSKSVNAEAAPVLYSKNNFKLIQFRLEAFQTSFLARIGRKNRDLIRKIEIGFCTTELWFALGPDSGRGPVLRENIPINLQRLTMSHEWSRFLHIKEANIRIAPSSLDERVVRLNKDLDIMANFLNMSMKFMPWLSKIVVGPGRKVSIVDADITVKHHKGVNHSRQPNSSGTKADKSPRNA